jgi:hypothetical protein
MKIFVFGNGNLSFQLFLECYVSPLTAIAEKENTHFILCDFRGVDTLMMEFLKCKTASVTIYHMGEKPRYLPDAFKTETKNWTLIGGFSSDKERDEAAIDNCTHFLAYDFNSDENRKSGTLKNIQRALRQNKTDLKSMAL